MVELVGEEAIHPKGGNLPRLLAGLDREEAHPAGLLGVSDES
jgi:hypothetical protein